MDEQALLRRIHDDPDADAPRQAYADWLRERADPRAELIDLQLAATSRALTPAEQRREAALLKQHAAAWLGPLAKVVDPRRMVFRRGFLASCRLLKKRGDDLRALSGHRAWSTVEEIDLEHVEPEVALAILPGLAHVRRLGGLPRRAVSWLGQRCAELPLDAIGCYLLRVERRPASTIFRIDFDAAAVQALTASPALRRVHSLRVGERWTAGSYRWLWSSPLAARLEHLSVGNIRDDQLVDGPLAVGSWLDVLHEHPSSLVTFELREDETAGWYPAGWQLCFSRGADGRFSVLDARFHPYVSRIQGPLQRLATGLEDTPDDAFTHIRIAPKLRTDLAWKPALEAAIARQKRLQQAELPR